MRNKMDYVKVDCCLELNEALSHTSSGPGSADGIASRLWPENAGFFSRRRQDNCTFSKNFMLDFGANQTSYIWALEVFSPGVKRPGYDTDHSPSSNTKVKNGWR
jgi:hypothetical protein